jgi:hypothetical protein
MNSGKYQDWPPNQPAIGTQGRADLARAKRRGYLLTSDPLARAGGPFWDHCRAARIPWVVVILGATSAKVRIDLEPARCHLTDEGQQLVWDLLHARLGRGRWDVFGGRRGLWAKRVPVHLAEELAHELAGAIIENSRPGTPPRPLKEGAGG